MTDSPQGRDKPSRELIEELCLRFVVNKPLEDTNSFERLLFLIEEAHWYYEDHIIPRNPRMRSLSIREFAAMMFEVCPGLEKYKGDLQMILKRFQDFKHTVPVMGAILLSTKMDKVLLVRGWSKNAAWGFPRGKRMKDETDEKCAIREVYEETGFDIKSRLNKRQFIEIHAGLQRVKLFIIKNVPENTQFKPFAKKEIGALAWHLVSELPNAKEYSCRMYHSSTGQMHRFYMVHVFAEQLRRWISNHRPKVLVVERPINRREKVREVLSPRKKDETTTGAAYLSFANFRFDRDAINRCLLLRN